MSSSKYFADFHDDIGVHLDKSSIAVICPSGIAGPLCQNLYHFLVEAQVQDGVHHARHGSTGAGTYGHEKRIFLVAELLAGNLLHFDDVFMISA